MTGTTDRPPRVRRTAEDRRRQLIGIGLEMLTTMAFHQVTVDEVARRAGISRSLLFHYFPTKRDYYAAVVRAAARRLLRATVPLEGAEPADRLRATVDAYVAFIRRRREAYVSVFRAPRQDEWILEIHEETQNALSHKVFEALGIDSPEETLVLAVRAWWAFAEHLCVDWTARRDGGDEELAAMLVDTLTDVVRRAAV
ncbi:TetR family transcriptional regulator [Herbihabitans rhizosphaerae]|uniref:TetR family transcriptional regulator n=1 Tax=Herbihabitans rhizosphaerae TaxID=1872711 RepID=A0A4Q7KBR8_9PSEU|nr:TetR/AcrR family transcriptional regulator [Herbihabitans rhizosphaerae]RZS30407.1 TetR family transcriptional regulator [Herbihabitans rhizosphaerae]